MPWALLLVANLLAAEPSERTWTIDGVERTAILHVPAAAIPTLDPPRPADAPPAPPPAPIVFAFHGHGGRAAATARKFRLHELWPEALVVYPQGLNTPGKFDPEGRRPGWQKEPGDQADRDLKLFDAILEDLARRYRVDLDRVYVTGHSNGGGFTYLLWATRHDRLAAVAPSAAGGRNIAALKPLPCLHIAGEKDETVPFAGQQRVMEAVRRANRCAAAGQPAATGLTHYAPSDDAGAPFASFIHPGDHAYPDTAPAHIVRFFQAHRRRTAVSPPPSAPPAEVGRPNAQPVAP